MFRNSLLETAVEPATSVMLDYLLEKGVWLKGVLWDWEVFSSKSWSRRIAYSNHSILKSGQRYLCIDEYWGGMGSLYRIQSADRGYYDFCPVGAPTSLQDASRDADTFALANQFLFRRFDYNIYIAHSCSLRVGNKISEFPFLQAVYEYVRQYAPTEYWKNSLCDVESFPWKNETSSV